MLLLEPLCDRALFWLPSGDRDETRRRTTLGSIGSDALPPMILMILMVRIGRILPTLFTVALTRDAAVQGHGHAAHAESTTPVPGDALFPVGDNIAEAVARVVPGMPSCSR